MSTSSRMSEEKEILYTAKTHTVGGREHGVGRSSDGRLEVKLSIPGSAGTGTNPEQLFAVGWSGCFEESMKLAAHKLKIRLPEETALDAEVDLCKTGDDYTLQARLNISVPGLERSVAQQVVDAAEQICTYSKAIRGNVDVTIKLV